ncbi:Papilin [Araneus ventricosus]|uniref:Papilin n=1 Tax=Araneus ventricosus TaxID=182803 RepID=A0A4Y2ING2_ARAVE|nr:Papilin [Araneus ventricosus]
MCGNGSRTRTVECSSDRETRDLSLCNADRKPVEFQSCTLGPCEEVKWTVSEWSGCQDSCSPSIQSRQVHCTNKDSALFPVDACDATEMPKVTKPCPKPARCEATWHASEWSEVSNPSLDMQV